MFKLQTKRILFRDHEPSDLEPYCTMESDALYRTPQIVHPRAELERGFRDTWLVPKPMGLLATIFKPDGNYVGRSGLYPFRGENDVIVPARRYWFLHRAAVRRTRHCDGGGQGLR